MEEVDGSSMAPHPLDGRQGPKQKAKVGGDTMPQPIDVKYVSDTRINTRIDGVLGSDAFDVLQAYCNTSTTQSSLD